jgi:hypothetical protein
MEKQTPEQKTSAENDYMVTFSVPIGVSIDIEATADSYQTTQQTSYKLNEKEQLIEIEMDASTVSLQGKSTITFMVIDKDTSIPLDDALVQVYHLNSTILLGEDTTQAGSAQIQIDSGTPVSYIVSKEGYRSIDGNYTVRTDYTISVVLELGGSTLDVTVLDGITNNPLNNVQVNIFSQSKNKLDGNLTDVSGNVKFNGLPEDDVVYVSACYTQQDFSYFCKTDIVDLKTTNQKTITLERRIQQNTRLLYVFINDFFNNPLPDAQVNIYQIVGDKELPYGDTYYLDSSGATIVPLKIGDKFLVVGTYKDVNASKVITITDETENKVILVIDTKSRLLNLQIININGTKVTEGNVLVKSKDDVVLYSEPLTTEDIFFESKGYTEFLTEYTDQNGNTFSSVLTPSPDNILLFVIRPQVIGNYPVIDFVGIEDSYGKRVPYISVDQDYFLIFNVLFPEGSTNGGVHIRVGEDNETDIENMSYGITGYVADKAKARYGTTYLPPTNASIDYLNVGEPGKLNKFLELTFSDKYSIGNRQIKVRVKALDLSQYKLKFNYRAWVSLDSNVYRYPKDTTLGDRLNSIEKQGLYAQTNSVEIDLFENPANCMNEFCISYQFIDEEMFNYPKDKFFGIQGNVYALEAVLYSLKNTSVDLYAETSPTNPLISFVSVSNNLNFPIISNSDISPQLDISQTGISLSSFQRQKVYLFFISQTPGVSYIDLSWKIGGTQTINEKFSFNIYEKKEKQAVFDPNFILPYGSKLNITLTDLNTNKPIEDAFIKIYDNKDNLVYSLKGNKLNGANGKYVIDQEFVSPKLNIVVSKFGYIPITKQLIVQDNTYLKAPDQVIIHVGEGELTSAQAFQVTNTGKQLITGITVSDPIWVEQVDGLEFAIDHPSSLPPNKSFSFVANATISSETQFDSAQANFIISGMVGTKEVARVVSVIVNRKKLVDNCLSIKPKELNTYIGMIVDSENTSSFIITNSCQKDIMINPQVLNLSSATNNGLEILLEGVTINAGEEKSIDVTIKNLIERKQVKQYSYDIVWSNPYYILPTTKLNVSIIDISKALIATPPVVYVPMSQLDTEQQAITTAQFFVKNIGTVPIYNIEIAHDPEYKTSYIGVQEYPRVINSLAPGQQLPITLKFQAMLKTTTLDDLYYTVKGNVPGLKEAVSSKTSIIFTISTPGCIKVEQTKLKYDIKIGESKAKTVTFVNQCAEPVIIEGIDKREMTYFQTFGYNPVFLTPIYMQGVTVPNVGVQAPIVSPYNVSTSSSAGLGVIPVGGTASYSLKIQGVTYGGTPGADMPIKFIGKLANSGLYASSQSILINLNIYEPDKEKQNDLRQTNQGIPIPVCGNEDEVRYYNVPKVNEGTCTGTNGYCDAQEAGKLLIKKVEELHTKVLQAAAQSNYNMEKSGCSREFASKGYCSISQLGSGTIEPIEFTLYLQNDAITPDLISKLLEKTNYKIKDFLIVPSSLKQMPSEVYGLSVIGNQLYLSENLSGCGRYKITIDGFIGSTPTQLLPQKANYYIIVEDYNRTEQCTKQITNYLNFMPKDTEFKKLQNPNTWLTVFIGDKNIGKAVAKSFLDEDRYSESKSLVSKNNIINIDTEELLINGEKTDALAKIIFNDPVLNTVSEPQQLNIIINNVYQTKKDTDTEEAVLPEKEIGRAHV